MFDFHKDKARYFQMQYEVTQNYILPFLKTCMDMNQPMHILEVGCAEAGVLKAFLDEGHTAVGIELNEGRLKLAGNFLSEEVNAGRIELVNRNIYDIDPSVDLSRKFDLIILKDVIEHIPDQDRLMAHLASFLSEKGRMFFAFPPWHMPFGGHQQICRNKILNKLPYFHLLPRDLYRWILQKGGEPDAVVNELLELKETGITIERFERIVQQTNCRLEKRRIYLTNPIYRYKFGLPVIRQLPILAHIPFLRNFYSMGVYYLVSNRS